MNELNITQQTNRRTFLQRGGIGLGSLALNALSQTSHAGTAQLAGKLASGGLTNLPHHTPTAKRVIYLFQSGAPSQFESFDYKPGLENLQSSELPDSVRMGQRLTGMTSGQSSFPIAASIFKFAQHGESGTWISELFPTVAESADDGWRVNQWLKKAVLLYFRCNDMRLMDGAPGPFWDKVPTRFEGFGADDFRALGARVVPGAVVRRGAAARFDRRRHWGQGRGAGFGDRPHTPRFPREDRGDGDLHRGGQRSGRERSRDPRGWNSPG